jgi:hypothetical protein
MMIECMAGKSGALHGHAYDATPFTFSEDKNNTAIAYFGEQLEAAGYNHYGTETLYSGVHGKEITVSDKKKKDCYQSNYRKDDSVSNSLNESLSVNNGGKDMPCEQIWERNLCKQ